MKSKSNVSRKSLMGGFHRQSYNIYMAVRHFSMTHDRRTPRMYADTLCRRPMPTTYADRLANHEPYIRNIKCLAAIYIYDDVQKVLSTRCQESVEISYSFRHFLPTAFRLPSDTAAFLDVLYVTPPLASTKLQNRYTLVQSMQVPISW